jgi:hypothetical protein
MLVVVKSKYLQTDLTIILFKILTKAVFLFVDYERF